MPTVRNPLGRILDSGGVAVGAEATLGGPSLVELYGRIGLDFVWSDFEHQGRSPYDSVVMEEQTRAAQAGDVGLLVRLPAPDPPLVRKALDAGVRNVLVPRVETAAGVRRAVESGRFRLGGERGDRGLGNGRANAWGSDMDGYPEREDRTVLIGAMIETAAAVENIDEILEVPELGFVFLGPWDISQSLGVPMETDHPEVRAAVEEVQRAARRAGVPVGGYFPEPAAARAAIEAGCQLVLIGDEVTAIDETFTGLLDAIERSAPQSD